MKNYDDLQTKLMQDTLTLRHELAQESRKLEKIQKKRKTIRDDRKCIALVIGAISLIVWLILGFFASSFDWYFVDEFKDLPKYVITVGVFFDFLSGIGVGFIVFGISYGIIGLFIPNDEKIEEQIESIEENAEETCNLILRPIVLSLWGKTLDQFSIPNKDNVFEKLRTKTNKSRFVTIYTDNIDMTLWIDLGTNLVEYKDNKYILTHLSIDPDVYPNKLGEQSFFVTCNVQKIENKDEKNFSLTEQTLEFQIDLE